MMVISTEWEVSMRAYMGSVRFVRKNKLKEKLNFRFSILNPNKWEL